MNNSNNISGAIAWMSNHKVAANLLMLTFIIGGFFMLSSMRQEIFPTYDVDVIKVSVAYPGAAPQEVEEGIILAIEEAVSGLDGIDEIKSTAKEGSAVVKIEAETNTDLQRLSSEIQNEVNRIVTFPVDIEKPIVSLLSLRKRGVTVVVYGDASESVVHEYTEIFRDELLQDPHITVINVSGVRPLEISIEVPQENLRRYNLKLDDIKQKIQQASIDLSGGSIRAKGGEIMIRVNERKDRGHEFASIPIISTQDGATILLRDIATIKDGYEDSDYFATYNSKRAMLLKISSSPNQTPLEISQAVHENLKLFKQKLPEGMQADILYDQSDGYADRIDLLLRNSALGIILVLAALALFLEIRLAFWVMMGIPISFMGSFLVLPLLDVSLNMISLFAFIIALGIVVDDAIVVGENIYRYRQEGDSPVDAATKGAKEMAMPVTFSILTNIATFMPLYFMPGTMGKIFQIIPVVLSIVFLVSLFESLFILPAHLRALEHKQRHGLWLWIHKQQQRFSHAFKEWVRHTYGGFLSYVLHHRALTIAVAISLLVVTLAFALSGRMGMQMFPKTESDFAVAKVAMPFGTPTHEVEKVINRLIASAQKTANESSDGDTLLVGMFANIGSSGGHAGDLTVYLAKPDIRETIMSTDAFTNSWRENFGEMAGIDTITFQADMGGPGSGSALTIELNHRDLDLLQRASEELAIKLEDYSMVQDIDSGYAEGKEQLDFIVKEAGKRLGLEARDVARQVRNSFYGSEIIRQQRGRNEIRVMVRLSEDERRSEYDLHNLLLRTPSGDEVPFYDVVSLTRSLAYSSIDRRNGRRVITVSADVTPRSKAGEVISDLQESTLPQLMQKYPGLKISFQGRQADMRESAGSLKLSFVLAMLVVYAMLSIPFQSYIQPLIVMISIPFGVIGAIFGHLIMGYSLSMVSMLGIIALSGIVVNDSLILINRANELHRGSNKSSIDVVHEAAISRFRPILLTTLTTFGGLMPMILETSKQAKILIPMALSMGFGILFATLITLVLVPVLYVSFSRLEGYRK
ncbi:MAG: efflux RND transporter permease subunit [Campylobacterota bacterium]|nr:efflux RND transporter permease subunit [Campylobacterota bacterium]